MGRNTPSILVTPPLRSKWSKAKKKAKKAAADIDKKNHDKKKKQAKAFKTMAKAFKQDLGPNLDKWAKSYPDFQKMQKLRKKEIKPAIKYYMKQTNAAPIDESIKEELRKTLELILREQKNRSVKAKELIESDLDLGLKTSKKETKLPPPIVVFKHPDIMRPVLSKAGKPEHFKVSEKLSIEVILDGKEVLKCFPVGKEYVNASAKIKDAGNFGQLVADIATGLKVADRNVGKGKKVADEQKHLDKEIDKAIAECADRATTEAARLGKLKRNVRWAKVKRGGKLVFTMVSATGGAVSIATTGIGLTVATSGVGIAVGITSIAVSSLGLLKSAIDIGSQIADMASSAEKMANGITKELKTVESLYKKWLKSPEVKKAGGVSHLLGTGELFARGFNHLAGPILPTLKKLKGDVGTFEGKIDSIEVGADKLAEKLTAFLVLQTKAQKQHKALKKLGRDALSKKEFLLLKNILSTIEKSVQQVNKTIKGVRVLNKRVKKNRKKFDMLDKRLKKVSTKKPLWSDIGSALVEATSGALIGTVLAVADPGEIKSITDLVTTLYTTSTDILDRAQELKEYSEDLKDAFDEDLNRARAKQKLEKKR